MKKTKTYKVKVTTTNATRNTCCTVKDEYIDCEDSVLYVASDSIAGIEKLLGVETILSITLLGNCYMEDK